MSAPSRRVGVQVAVLRTAEIAQPHGYVYRPAGDAGRRLAGFLRSGRPPVQSPCLAFVLRHPTAGVVLVDTGLHPDAHGDLRRDFGPLMSLVFRGLRPVGPPFDEQLRRAGVVAEEVGMVVMTHLHVDHTSGMRLLSHAEFVCSSEEWAAAHRRLASREGYVGHHLPRDERVWRLDLEADGAPFGPFGRTLDLFGDGSVRLISTPGHTAGHLSVLVRLDQGGEVLLVGDAAYTRRGLDEQLLPLLTHDDEASRRSLRELKAFADRRPDAVVVPTHDPEAWQQLDEAAASVPEEAMGTP